MSTPSDANELAKHCAAEFDKLLADARRRSELYYLLNLFGWSDHGGQTKYQAQCNSIVDALVQAGSRGATIPAGHMLSAMQLVLESKAILASMRNFVSACAGRYMSPIPWDKNKGEWSRLGQERASVKTTKIVENISRDMKELGYTSLAEQIHQAYMGDLRRVRNAVAHAAFVGPTVTGDQAHTWTFGEFVLAGETIGLKEFTIEHAQLQVLIRSALAFFYGYAEAIGRHRAPLEQAKFKFTSRNQMRPDEQLDCEFLNGDVRIRYRGTPLW